MRLSVTKGFVTNGFSGNSSGGSRTLACTLIGACLTAVLSAPGPVAAADRLILNPLRGDTFLMRLPPPITVAARHGTTVASEMALAGRTTVIVSPQHHVFTFDISDPAHPTLSGSYRARDGGSVRVKKACLQIVDATGQLLFLDLSDSRQPRPLSLEEGLRKWCSPEPAPVANSELPWLGTTVDGWVYLAREDLGVVSIRLPDWVENRVEPKDPGLGAIGFEPLRPDALDAATLTPLGLTVSQFPQSLKVPDPTLVRPTLGSAELAPEDVVLELVATDQPGRVKLAVSGTPNTRVRIQRTSNLADGWADWAEVLLDSSTVTLLDDAGTERLFFRVLVVPSALR